MCSRYMCHVKKPTRKSRQVYSSLYIYPTVQKYLPTRFLGRHSRKDYKITISPVQFEWLDHYKAIRDKKGKKMAILKVCIICFTLV